MRNAKTRLLSLVLAVIMVVSMLPATVLADNTTEPIQYSENITVVATFTATGSENPTATYGITPAEAEGQYYVTTDDVADTAAAYSQAVATEVAAGKAFGAWHTALSGKVDIYQSYAITDVAHAGGYASNVYAYMKEDATALTVDLHNNTITSKVVSGLSFANPFDTDELTIQNGTLDFDTGSSRAIISAGSSTVTSFAGAVTLENLTLIQNGSFQPISIRGGGTWILNGGKLINKSTSKAAILYDKQASVSAPKIYLMGGQEIDSAGKNALNIRYACELYLIDAKLSVTDETHEHGVECSSDAVRAASIKLSGQDPSGTAFKSEAVKTTEAGKTVWTFEELPAYEVIIGDVTNGTVVADVASAYEGDTVTLTIEAAQGFEIESLTVAGESVSVEEIVNNEYSFEMPAADVTVTATFAALGDDTKNIIVEESEHGTVAAAANAVVGTEVTLTVEPEEGYELAELIVNGEDVTAAVTEGTYTFTMPNAAVTVSATFTPVKTMAVSYSDGTDTTPYYTAVEAVGDDTFTTVQAAANAAFTLWHEKGTGTIELYQDWEVTDKLPGWENDNVASVCINVQDGESLVFKANNHTVTNNTTFRLFCLSGQNTETYLEVRDATLVSTNSANTNNGTILYVGKSSLLSEAGTVKFYDCHATSTSGSYGIAVTGGSDLNVYLIGGTYDVEYITDAAAASATNLYLQNGVKIYSTSATYGIARNRAGTVHLDNAVLYTQAQNITQDGGTVVYPDGKALKTVETDTVDFTVLTAPTGTIYKHTVETLYSVEITTPENGSVEANVTEALAGDTVTLTIEAADGFKVESLTVGGESVSVEEIVNNEYSFEMPAANVTVTATFSALSSDAKNITVEESEHGTVTAAANAVVGTKVTLTVEPEEGYELAELIVNGEDVTAAVTEGAYTFTMPNAAVTVTAAFTPVVIGEAVSYSDGTNTTTYYLAEADGTVKVDGTEYAAYDTMQKAMQAAYDVWKENDSGTITLLHDYTMTGRLAASGSNAIVVEAGESLVLDLNGHTMDLDTTVYRSGSDNFRMFTVYGEGASLEVKGPGKLDYAGNDYLLICGSSGNTTKGTVKFTDVDVTYTSTKRAAMYLNTCDEFRVTLSGGTFTSPTVPVVNTKDDTSAYNLILTNAVEVYCGAETPIKLASGTLYLEDAGLYTAGENIASGDNIYLGDGVSCKTLVSEESDEVEGYTYYHYLSGATHNEVVLEAVAPTCEETGLTAGSKCGNCGYVLTAQEVVPALNHAWTVTYDWSDDNTTCTATRACGNDAAHNLTETVTATEENGTYTATFEAEWAETQTKETVVAPTTYTVTVAETTNGTVTADKTEAAEGETVTLTFAANSGYYLASLTVNGAEVDVDGNTATFTMPAADVTVASVFNAQLAPSGTNMKLGAALKVQFAISISKLYAADTNHYALVTKTDAAGNKNTVRVEQADWTLYSGSTYLAGYTIAAREMGDIIEVMFYNSKDQAVVTGPKTQSAQLYAETLLNKSGTNAKTMNFLVDMLNYGAEAQLYFTYDTENLVNANLTEAQKAYATSDEDATPVNNQVKGTGFAGSTLGLQDVITLSFVFNNSSIGDVASAYAVLSYTNYKGEPKEVTIPGTDFGKYSTTRSQIEFKELAVADYNTLVTCNIYNSEDTLVAYGSDSMESYAARSIANSLGVAPTAAAVVKFGVSSYKYLEG